MTRTQTLPPVRAVTLRDAERLVGMPYVAGRFTCMHLAVWAQEVLWHRKVARGVPTRLPVHGSQQAAMVQQWRHQLCDPVDFPQSGDVVLFHDDGSDWPWHIGTVLVDGFEVWVLHTHQGIGASVLERLHDAQRRCLRVEGYYRWREAPEHGQC